ncbi:MAG: hypothetical protein ACTSYI_12495, partial [Promethearchaeota archaeon]
GQEAHFSSSAEIHKEVIVGSLHVNSTFSTGGLLNADHDAKFSSSSEINGNTVVGGTLRVSGAFECKGSVQVDEDARFSSAASVEGNVIVGGYLRCSGAFEAGKKVVADNGIKLSGAASIAESVLSDNDVDVTGRIEVGENIEAKNVYIGVNTGGLKAHREGKASKIHGSILAKNEIDIEDAYIDRDLRANRVFLGPNTKVFGTVYYATEFRAHAKAQYSKAQQILPEDV